MNKHTEVSASQENYLEAIYHIVTEKKAAKPRDIANALGVNNSSVTGALRILAEKQLINYAPFEVITLTAEGEAIGIDIAQRHAVFHSFFVDVLSIDEEEANQVACKLEHVISPAILERFTAFLSYIEDHPLGTSKWKEKNGFYSDEKISSRTSELLAK